MSNAGWERIAVAGVTGSGKTTLAQTLADLLHAPHIELDSLYWGPGWTETPREVLRERVAQALDASAWVVDGNYGQARDIVWRRAAALVWLDDTWPVIFWRLASRTIQRIAARTELWNGNRENWREALFSVDRGLLRSTARQPKKTRKISCRMHSGFAVNRRSGAV